MTSRRRRDLVHNVVAAVDIERLASDQAGGVMGEEGYRGADIVDADEAAGGRF